MTEAAARPDLAAGIGTTDPGLRQQSDNLIVRIVNVLWKHPGPISFRRLLIETDRPESKWKIQESLYLLIRSRVVEETAARRFRIADDFRRWTR